MTVKQKSLYGKSLVLAIMLFMFAMKCSDLFEPTEPGADNEITFSVDQTGTATPSSSYILDGTVTSTEDLDSVIIRIRDHDGDLLNDDGFILSNTTRYDLEDSDIELDVNSSDCNGTYTVNIRAYSAGESESVTIDVEVSGAKDCSSTGDPVLTLGSLSGSSTVTPDSPRELTGSYSCTNCDYAVSFDATVKDSAGAVVADNTVTAHVTKATEEYTVSVSAAGTACMGNYRITVTAQSGTLTETVSKTVTVSEAVDCSAPTGDLQVSEVLVLGAQNASAGSSLDIDSFEVLTINNAKIHAVNVDLIVGFSDAADVMMGGSPKWANDSSLAVANGWSSYNTSQFMELSETIAMNSATQDELESLWSDAEDTEPAVSLSVGKQYLTVTSQGAIAVFEVLELSNSADGSVSIRVARTEAGAATAPTPFVPEGLVISEKLTVGADENTTYGSSIDLDVPKVMLAAEARNASAGVDLIYVYSFSADEDVLGTPAWGDESDFSFVSDWATYNDTKFYKTTETAFENVTTKAELEDLWQETLAIDPSVPVDTDDVVIAKTDQGTLALIKIVSHTPGETGQIEIKVAK